MYITTRNTQMSREAAIIENTCVSNYALGKNRPKMDILGFFETFGGKSDQEISIGHIQKYGVPSWY